MLTVIDKAIAAFLPGLVLWLNQKWGFHFNTDPGTLAGVAAAISAILVYFVPNKAT